MKHLLSILLIMFSPFVMANNAEFVEIMGAYCEKDKACMKKSVRSDLTPEEKASFEKKLKEFDESCNILIGAYSKKADLSQADIDFLACFRSRSTLSCDQLNTIRTNPDLEPPACKALFEENKKQKISDYNEVMNAFCKKGAACKLEAMIQQQGDMTPEKKALMAKRLNRECSAIKDEYSQVDTISHKDYNLLTTCLSSLTDLPCDQVKATRTNPSLLPLACQTIFDNAKKRRLKAGDSSKK